MRRTAVLLPALAVLGGCLLLNEVPQPPPVQAAAVERTVVADARLAFVAITGTLPEAGNDLPPDLLAALDDLVPVRLDLMLQPPLEPGVVGANGETVALSGCAFGVVDARTVSVPTGSNHMLLDVRLGAPEAHPANLFSCEYDPANITDDTFGAAYRLRGCYLPQSVSIPTAVLWVLNPLPASACGLGD